MKYSIYINQKAILDNGFYDSDILDWVVFDYLKDWHFSSKKRIMLVDNIQYIWINYTCLLQEIPLLKINKHTLSKKIKKLESMGIIKLYRDKDNTLYFCFTEKANDILFTKDEEQNQAKEGAMSKETDLCQKTTQDCVKIDQPMSKNNTGLCQKTTQHNHNTNNYLNNIMYSNMYRGDYKGGEECEKEKIPEDTKKEEKINLTKNVKMTECEIKKLVENYTLNVAINSIIKLDLYLSNKKKRYVDHYKVMHSWVLDDVLRKMCIAGSKLEFDKKREERRKEYKNEPYERQQENVFDNIIPYPIHTADVIYDNDRFFSKLKEELEKI